LLIGEQKVQIACLIYVHHFISIKQQKKNNDGTSLKLAWHDASGQALPPSSSALALWKKLASGKGEQKSQDKDFILH